MWGVIGVYVIPAKSVIVARWNGSQVSSAHNILSNLLKTVIMIVLMSILYSMQDCTIYSVGKHDIAVAPYDTPTLKFDLA
jgi:hypothetical protein